MCRSPSATIFCGRWVKCPEIFEPKCRRGGVHGVQNDLSDNNKRRQGAKREQCGHPFLRVCSVWNEIGNQYATSSKYEKGMGHYSFFSWGFRLHVVDWMLVMILNGSLFSDRWPCYVGDCVAVVVLDFLLGHS